MKEPKYDVVSMLDKMEQKLSEGLLLITQLRAYTSEGYEDGIKVVCDLLDLDSEIYIASAMEQGFWAVEKKEDK